VATDLAGGATTMDRRVNITLPEETVDTSRLVRRLGV
jgi:hypothetical protein